MKFFEMFDRKYLTRVVLLILGVLLIVGLLFYFGYHFMNYFTSDLELADARVTTVSDKIEADAYIMRSESPIYTSSQGSIVPEVHDGSHISSGTLIAQVYSQASPEIEERLDEIDEQIALYEKSKDEDRSVLSTSGIENSIYQTLENIRLNSESGNYGDAISLRTSLLVSIKKRAIITGEITDYDAQIAKLKAEKENLRSKLGKCLETVYSSNAGYYFSTYDGYGKIFSPSLIDSMTYNDFVAMTESDSPDNSPTVGVIVSNYRWYIACIVSKAKGAEIDELGKCDVTFSYSGTTLQMRVERIIPELPGNNCVLILSSGEINAGFDYTRVQPVEISGKSYTGFEVPKSAIRVVDGYEGVYIKDEVTIEFRRINVIFEGDDYVICNGDPYDDIQIVNGNEDNVTSSDKTYSWIRQNDIIVVSGTELVEGKVVD